MAKIDEREDHGLYLLISSLIMNLDRKYKEGVRYFIAYEEVLNLKCRNQCKFPFIKDPNTGHLLASTLPADKLLFINGSESPQNLLQNELEFYEDIFPSLRGLAGTDKSPMNILEGGGH